MKNLQLKISADFFKEEVRNDYKISKEMKQIWAVELDLLNELDRVCRANNLPYYLSGGSLLGAVRHQGYIPWDDDVDVMMHREDFDRLCQLADQFDQPYFFQTNETDPGSMRGHAQLRNSDTTAILESERQFRYPFNQGIFIDIFPLDNVPDDPEERASFLADIKHTKYRAKQYYRYCLGRPNPKLTAARRAVLYLHFFFLKLRFRQRNPYYEKFERDMVKYNETETKNVAMVTLSTESCCWPRTQISQPIRVPFEMLSLPIAKDYDALLTKQYGDWHVMVKADNMHRGVLFDPNKSYKEYLQGEAD